MGRLSSVRRVDPAGFPLPFQVRAISSDQARTETVAAIKSVADTAGIEIYAAPLYEFSRPKLVVPNDDWDRLIDLLLQQGQPGGLQLSPLAAGELLPPGTGKAKFFLKRDRKARAFIAVATSPEGAIWGTDAGVDLEACFVYEDVSERTKHKSSFVSLFTQQKRLQAEVAGVKIDTFEGLAYRNPKHIDFAIDAVYKGIQDWELLRYSLRSLASYAPWVRHVWLVTDEAIPDWIDPQSQGLSVKTEVEFAFVSSSDEVAEHFLRINPRAVLTHAVNSGLFFESNGVIRTNFSQLLVNVGDPNLEPGSDEFATATLNQWAVEHYGRVANRPARKTVVPTTWRLEALVNKHQDAASKLDTASLGQTMALFEGLGVEGDQSDSDVVLATAEDLPQLHAKLPIPSPWEVSDASQSDL